MQYNKEAPVLPVTQDNVYDHVLHYQATTGVVRKPLTKQQNQDRNKTNYLASILQHKQYLQQKVEQDRRLLQQQGSIITKQKQALASVRLQKFIKDSNRRVTLPDNQKQDKVQTLKVSISELEKLFGIDQARIDHLKSAKKRYQQVVAKNRRLEEELKSLKNTQKQQQPCAVAKQEQMSNQREQKLKKLENEFQQELKIYEDRNKIKQRKEMYGRSSIRVSSTGISGISSISAGDRISGNAGDLEGEQLDKSGQAIVLAVFGVILLVIIFIRLV